MGGTPALLSLLGGVWFPVNSGTFHDIAEAPPSFWLVQASHLSIGGGGWSARGVAHHGRVVGRARGGRGLGVPARPQRV
jgi:hypothetical protein